MSTSSSAWRTIPSLSFVSSGSGSNKLCALNELSVSLSANLRGAPVRFRVLMDGGPVLRPGPARFAAAAQTRTVMATWAGNAGCLLVCTSTIAQNMDRLPRHSLMARGRAPELLGRERPDPAPSLRTLEVQQRDARG